MNIFIQYAMRDEITFELPIKWRSVKHMEVFVCLFLYCSFLFFFVFFLFCVEKTEQQRSYSVNS